MGNCSFFKYWINSRCNGTYHLRSIYFRSPNDIRENEEMELCEMHFKDIFNELDETIVQLRRKRESKFLDNIKRMKIARENDSAYDYNLEKNKVDSIQERVRVLRDQTCRNFLCSKNLEHQMEKIFTATVFSLRGKAANRLNFCSRECWMKFKARCGKEIPLAYGPLPKTLDAFTNA